MFSEKFLFLLFHSLVPVMMIYKIFIFLCFLPINILFFPVSWGIITDLVAGFISRDMSVHVTSVDIE
jgi:hypothetical protein